MKKEKATVSKRAVLPIFLVLGTLAVVTLVPSPAAAQAAPSASQDDPPASAETVEAVEPEEEEWVEGKKGLRYKDLVVGEGEVAERGDTVQVHYTGWLEDGTKFDSSLERGAAFAFRLGEGGVIRGWELGVEGMREGGKRRLEIPPKLGYGNRGIGPIPPKSTLIFEIELLTVQ